jgi:predicted nuclease with TOPRIM domain
MIFNALKANKAIEVLTEEKGKLAESLTKAESELKDAKAQLETVTGEKEKLSKQLESLTGELENAKKSANKQAAEVLATVGVSEPVKEAAKQPTLAELTEQLATLQKSDPKAAAELYKEFRSQFVNRK